jgi:transposase-like protein
MEIKSTLNTILITKCFSARQKRRVLDSPPFFTLLSRPEIAIQKSKAMKEGIENKYVKRTQKDYTLAFKLEVVQEIEIGSITAGEAKRKYGVQGHATVLGWLRKYGSFDWENQTTMEYPKSPQQKLMELEQKILLLEKQNARLHRQVEQSDKKAIVFDMMIDLAEKEYNIPIRKNSSPVQSSNSPKNVKKA